MSFSEQADKQKLYQDSLLSDERAPVELTLSRAVAALLRGWWITVCCCVLAILIGESYLAVAQPYYSAGMTLVPKENQQDQGIGGQARLLLGNSGEGKTRFEVMMLLMDSDRLADELVKRGGLQLVFDRQWDANSHQWIRPTGLRPAIMGFLKRQAGLPAWEAPDAQALRRYLDTHAVKKLIKSSDALELSFTHEQPEIAFWIAQNVLSATDDLYRADEGRIVDGRIKHLKSLLDTETNASYRQNLISLLQVQEQNRMMLMSGENIASRVVEAPVLPVKPAGPLFASVLMISVGLGLFAGVVLSVVVFCGLSGRIFRYLKNLRNI